MRKISLVLLCSILIFIQACRTQNEQSVEEKIEKITISGLIVEKEFVNKGLEGSGIYELYFRASVQDYFIKLCESTVAKEELEKYLAEDEMAIPPPITVEAEIVYDDYFDICNDEHEIAQSRVGTYMRIFKIVD